MPALKKHRPFRSVRPPSEMVRVLRTFFAEHGPKPIERKAVETAIRKKAPRLLAMPHQTQDLCLRLMELVDFGELACERNAAGRWFRPTGHLQPPDSRKARPGAATANSFTTEEVD
jgi:hypothetical protein